MSTRSASLNMHGTSLDNLPWDILFELFKELPLTDLMNLRLTRRVFNNVYQDKEVTILASLVRRFYSPADEFFRLLAVLRDGTSSSAAYLSTPIRVLFDGGGDRYMISLGNSRPSYQTSQNASTITLKPNHLPMLKRVCHIVTLWTCIFPQMRFRAEADRRRCLRPLEEFRLRRAIYRWWLYALSFQGKFDWWDDFEFDLIGDEEDDRDTFGGRAFVRQLSTAHILELRDLFRCVYELVSHDICPSIDRLRQAMGGAWHPTMRKHAWGCWKRNYVIVNTYLKLPPDDLLRLWVMKYEKGCCRAAIRDRATEMIPGLEVSMQTLGFSLDAVLRERAVQDAVDFELAAQFAESLGLSVNLDAWESYDPPRPEPTEGGILDWNQTASDLIAKRYSSDGSKDGSRVQKYPPNLADSLRDVVGSAGWVIERVGLVEIDGDDGDYTREDLLEGHP